MYIYIYIYGEHIYVCIYMENIYVCVCVYIYIWRTTIYNFIYIICILMYNIRFLRFFSVRGYYKIFNTVPCAVV